MRLTVFVALMLAVIATGCNRAFYRTQADDQANCLIDQKALVAGSDPESFRIDVDPRSRMFDPFDPDQPPMPPDDPLAHEYLKCIDGKKAAKFYRNAPRTPFVENPDWRAYLPTNEKGALAIDLTGAVDVALVHSPNYQSELEELYLSALDVSFERFRFDTQFFGGSSIFYTADGRVRSGSGESSSLLNVSPLRPANNLRLQKLTATGGQLVVGLANSLVWQFAGPNDYTSTTLLDFTVVQPLLRTGGRTLVLERLTIAERALLANVRAMERFRRGFYLEVAIGRDAGPGPSRRGGFFGGAGLQGFTGVGGGGFGRVGGGGIGVTGGAGAGSAGGYIGLLQTNQEIQNQRANVAALKESVLQLQASYDAGRIDRFQVDLARQALFNAQSRLLSADAGYQSSLDDFKVDRGLPPDLELELTDPLLDQFSLRSSTLTLLQQDSVDTAASMRPRAFDPDLDDGASVPKAEVLALGPLATADGEPLPQPVEEPADKAAAAELSSPAVPDWVENAQRLVAEAKSEMQTVVEDLAAVQAALPSRKAHLERLLDRDEVQQVLIEEELLAPERVEKRLAQLEKDHKTLVSRMELTLERLEQAIAEATAQATENSAEPPLEQTAIDQKQAVRESLSDLSSQLLALSLIQARARLDAIDIEPTELTAEQALAIASQHRRDWANNRASLVDTWRLIFFNANDLLSDLDLVFSGDIGNVGDNPFRLRDTNGRLRIGLEFDAPLTRLGERNVYRQSLIEYQQSKRSYYQFIDRVYQGLRNTIRQIRLNEVNLELRREAVFVAIAQVDLTQIRLSEPPKPGEEGEFSSTTARDLVQALSDLLNVQNDFLSVWVNNLIQKMNLEFDLGIMQIDQLGQRIPIEAPLTSFLGTVPHSVWGDPLPSGDDVLPVKLPPCEPQGFQVIPGDSSPVEVYESIEFIGETAVEGRTATRELPNRLSGKHEPPVKDQQGGLQQPGLTRLPSPKLSASSR